MFDNFFPVRRKGADKGSGVATMPDPGSLAEEFFRSAFDPMARTSVWGSNAPLVDVSETDDDITVTAELPGLDPKEVDVSIERSMLTIKGEKKVEREEKNERRVYTERSYGSFRRSISLPSAVEADKAKASFKDGVLTVTLPKDATAKPKRITINA